MVRRLLVGLLACAACATVADLEVNRAGNDGPARDSDDSGVVEEGGAITVADAGSEATSAEGDASAPVVGCVRSTNDGRDCCYSPDAGIAQASLRTSGCASSTRACQSDDDCGGSGGKCTTLTCKGVLFGVCAAAAPPWFVCPP